MKRFKLLSFSAIAQDDEVVRIRTPFGPRAIRRIAGAALHPDREPLSVLQAIRADLGTRHFAAQYLQMPAPPEGNIINPDWFGRYDTLPVSFDYVLQSWDAASKDTVSADWSVCVTMGIVDQKIYLIDVLRKKLTFPALLARIKAHGQLHRANICVIEESPAGIAIIQQLRADNMPGLQAKRPLKDKVVRIETHSARLERGDMLIPREAPWLHDYLHELMMFPKGKHDDQVDATSQAMAYIWPVEGPAAYINYIRAELSKREQAETLGIRLNYPDMGRQFQLVDRIVVRDRDGSFLVNEEEYRSLRTLEGIYRVDGN